jgi:hypothetical protein
MSGCDRYIINQIVRKTPHSLLVCVRCLHHNFYHSSSLIFSKRLVIDDQKKNNKQ